MKNKGYDISNSIKAVDFDGTLSKESKPHDPTKTGPPIKPMVNLVRSWIKEGAKVVIFTSRMCTAVHSDKELRRTRLLIEAWCVKHLGKRLPVTAEKHPAFEYWDNKAHRVESNTGRVLAKRSHTRAQCPYLHVKNCKGCGRSCPCYTRPTKGR